MFSYKAQSRISSLSQNLRFGGDFDYFWLLKLELVSLAVPLVFHLFFNWYGFANGYYRQHPTLAMVGKSMLVIGLWAHGLPLWKARRGIIQPPRDSSLIA